MLPEERIAFLIQAHHQPQLLFQLIDKLGHKNFHFFIHIDKKSDIRPFKEILKDKENINFIEDRVKVNWGGFSQVQASLNLIDAAFSHTKKFTRYSLLSGCDYPIKNPEYIYSVLSDSIDYVHIDCAIDSSSGHISRITHRSFFDSPFRNTKIRLLRSLAKKVFKLIHFLEGPRDFYKDMRPYHGSSWWSITHSSMVTILSFIESNPDFLELYKKIGLPDENFFQTLINNLSFQQKNLSSLEADNIKVKAIHYIDWESKGVTLPKTLENNDFKEIKKSNALFARKFDKKNSTELVRLINDSHKSKD